MNILRYLSISIFAFLFSYTATASTQTSSSNNHAEKRAIGTLKFIRADGHRPFGQAMKQLLPTGWRTEIARDVRLPARISWSGNDQWNHVIEKTLPRYSLKATFDTSGKRVLIQQAEKTVKSGLFSAPVTGVKKTETRHIEQGMTLRTGLEKWAAAEPCATGKWKVAWKTPVNYSIDAQLVFSGNFMDALNSTFALYQQAEKPLYASVNKNQCVLIITDIPGDS
ncbi:toxin co-regulated pilus biosynthesis Q family protein [Escherichia coli]|jgi:hypothetical protein|uniref:toxin co-regulated pilus biosynthesis Q family protein n=1 Tax=Enterobacteriaceae TaxID=543 RepID=UPI000FFB71F7|nr:MULTISPECIES: toxin co-regulated pilus biosynthesis Q family protein [Enterobacteriaceae]HEC9228026.1 toxin co-regulated pilus biosynthesis Q family protein [Salmonella enterica subsp. enterica serovar Newport]EFE0663689.1 hypothetical protein [Escherichia coli]EFG5904655.1 hypothetical protein [Escherichia coli]EJM9748302.1 toxin co-regulated pilus biosynthesis Q family protein [Escherichia coli]EKR8122570.1 toxin co-regulated pilus biosynthesis Q family protein [Escherichia coli]